ncbi:MAG: hypothetical protein ACJATG_001971, partial [Dinoroseobacter sp.]
EDLMPAATSRRELLAITKCEFENLNRTLDTVSQELAITPFQDGLTLKDIIGHRAHWITLYFTWVEGARAGKAVQTPAPGYKWNALKAYNAAVRQDQFDLTWIDVRDALSEQHARLMAFFEAETDASLYTAPLHPWMNEWTLGRWGEAAGASHYRSAAKFARACLKASQEAPEGSSSSDNSVSKNRSNASRLTGSN